MTGTHLNGKLHNEFLTGLHINFQTTFIYRFHFTADYVLSQKLPEYLEQKLNTKRNYINFYLIQHQFLIFNIM